ncbi:MAG: drug/metabolite transporter (DMT)-like permease [Desulforhopalus sp.]|jgi:drug/metabolite transporter (DMT)-like permease
MSSKVVKITHYQSVWSYIVENVRGSFFMVFAMAAFAVEDMFVKAAAKTLPVGEILILFGLGGTLIYILLTLLQGDGILHRKILSKVIIIRAISESAGRLFYTLAIALTPLSSASAILQATPLIVVMGAAIFFGEKVGWQRWTAIGIGLIGVMMILRPGLEGFEAASLFALLGTLGFAGRDLATRAAPLVLSNMQLGIYGFFILIPTGAVLVPFTGGLVLPDSKTSLEVLGVILFGVTAYYFLTCAMRTGEVSVVTPFRYTRLVFALIIGLIVFSERPDFMTLLGSAIVVLSGIFSLLKSRNRQQ